MKKIHINKATKHSIAKVLKNKILIDLEYKEYTSYNVMYREKDNSLLVCNDTDVDQLISNGLLWLSHIEWYANQQQPLIKDIMKML